MSGYDFDRLDLLSGQSQQVQPAASAELIQNFANRTDGVVPSGDRLFTSGTLGQYSEKLMEVDAFQEAKNMVAAD